MTQDELFKVLVAHCKEYGFIFPSSEIYDGLAAVYDYGQMGVELKNNIKQYWWNAMTRLNENIVGIDSCIFMHPRIWEASGHVGAFNDPLIDNKDSKRVTRRRISQRSTRTSPSASSPVTTTPSAVTENSSKNSTINTNPSASKISLSNFIRTHVTRF